MKNLFLHPKAFLLLIFLFFSHWGCVTNPVTGKKEIGLVSQKKEIQMGQKQYLYGQQTQGGEYVLDPELTEYVKGIGKKLAAVSDRSDLPYEFVVLNNNVPNAWALPGGKIAINRGLLTELNSEAELAAVLAHEIVHAAARHGAKSMERNMAKQMGLSVGNVIVDSYLEDQKALGSLALSGAAMGLEMVNLKYGRKAELESDKYGIKYMVKAGYDPQAAVTLQETFLKLAEGKNTGWLNGLFSSHPPSRERIEANQKTVAEYPSGGFVGAEEYKKKIAILEDSKMAYKKLEEGHKAIKEKNPRGALSLARAATIMQPKEAHFHALAAQAYLHLGKSKEALEESNEAVALNEKYFAFYLQQAQLKDAKGDVDGAREAYQKSYQLLPTNIAEKWLQLHP